MHNIKEIKGNIFNSKCQTIVNTVNCVGVMGRGIALEYKNRYPEMYEKYKKLCEEQKISSGTLWIYKTKDRWILNFPTKNHWRYPSKMEYIEKGLKKLKDTYHKKGIKSIAFPQLGVSSGGLDWENVRSLMKQYLSQMNIPVEIYVYSNDLPDALFSEFLEMLKCNSPKELQMKMKINKKQVLNIINAINKGNINNFDSVQKTKGIGKKTIEKIYLFIQNSNNTLIANAEKQLTLF
jgi:O-acetyl-ADP-ribose deacetylase (regulator of RNase III)